MKALLIPVLLAVLGPVLGVSAGLMMKPAEKTEAETAKSECTCPDANKAEDKADPEAKDATPGEVEYVKFNNQFVVPVVSRDRVDALVVIAISLEVDLGARQAVYAVEPKLRDAYLRVMFDHASMGGFEGNFTEGELLGALRKALKDTSVSLVGDVVRDVLITDIGRQDV
jgi:flagellar FliL protein